VRSADQRLGVERRARPKLFKAFQPRKGLQLRRLRRRRLQMFCAPPLLPLTVGHRMIGKNARSAMHEAFRYRYKPKLVKSRRLQ
jgi:hypothetical protein